MLGNNLDARCSGSTLRNKKTPEFCLHPLDAVYDYLQLEELLLFESIPTKEDQYK